MLRWGPLAGVGVFGGGIGGYARYNEQAARSLLAEGFDLVQVAVTAPTSLNRFIRSVELPGRMAKDCIRIVLRLLRSRPAVLHITALYWRSIYREWWATRFAGLCGVPVLYDVRAGGFEQFFDECGPVARLLVRDIGRRACRVSVEGKGLQTYVAERLGWQADWIPNCVLMADLQEYPAALLVKPKLGQPIRLIYVGYVTRDKGVDVLIASAQQLAHDRHIQVHLVGKVAEDLRADVIRHQAVADGNLEIVTHGRLPYHELMQLLQEQHVFVFLSRFVREGQSNAVTEAMSVGLPVLSSRVGYLSELVGDDCGRFVEDSQDVEEVVSTLRQMMADWPPLQSMGTASRDRVESHYTDRFALEAMAEIYRACAAAKRA